MSTYTFRLDFRSGDTSIGQIPGVMLHVALNNATESEDGDVWVSHACVGAHEFRQEIERLKNELDQIGRDGLRQIERYHSSLGRRK